MHPDGPLRVEENRFWGDDRDIVTYRVTEYLDERKEMRRPAIIGVNHGPTGPLGFDHFEVDILVPRLSEKERAAGAQDPFEVAVRNPHAYIRLARVEVTE